MRLAKNALCSFVFFSGIFGASISKAASSQQTVQAIHEKFLPKEIQDLDDSNQEQVICLALNLYHEVRGSSEADIKAVGFATRNRVLYSSAKDYCTIIWSKGQFVWTKWSLSRIMPREMASWRKMVSYADGIVMKRELVDTTHGADSFFSRKIRTPNWARHCSRRVIGGHVFVSQF